MKINSVKIKNKFFIITNIFIALFIILFEALCYKEATFFCEDMDDGLYRENENMFSCLKNSPDIKYGGGYFQSFLLKFFVLGFPFLFNFHPLDYASIPRGIIFGIFMACLVYSIAKFIKPVYFSKILYLVLAFFSASYVFYLYFVSIQVEINNYVFFRYPFSIFIYNVFWFFIYKNFIKNKLKINIFNLLLMLFLAFALSRSMEILIAASLCNMFFLFICSFFTHKKFYKFNLIFYSLSLFFAFSSMYWILSLKTKYPINKLSLNFNYLPEFPNYFLSSYLPYICIYVILLIPIIIGLWKSPIKTTFKAVLFSLIMEFSTLICFFSLFGISICNDLFLFPGVNFTFKILLFIPIIILISCLIKQIKKYKLRKIIILFISSILFIFSIKITYNLISDFHLHGHIRIMKYKRIVNYINEKMLRFYYLQNQIPVIYNYDSILTNNHYINHGAYQEGDCDFNSVTDVYLTHYYKDDSSKKLGFCVSKNASDLFYDNGGIFTEEELHNIKFSRLKDENFIFNRNIKENNKILTKEEVKERLDWISRNIIF